jgi:hypothetical protein
VSRHAVACRLPEHARERRTLRTLVVVGLDRARARLALVFERLRDLDEFDAPELRAIAHELLRIADLMRKRRPVLRVVQPSPVRDR